MRIRSCANHGPDRGPGSHLARPFSLAVFTHHWFVLDRAALRLNHDSKSGKSPDGGGIRGRARVLAAKSAAVSGRSSRGDFAGTYSISFGAVLGLAMQIIVTAVACAGEIVGLSIGLGFAELQFREAGAATPVLYDLMLWVGLMGYITAGGPVWLFAAIVHSFQSGVTVSNLSAWNDLSSLGGTIIVTAVWLAMPVMAVSLSINITVGLMTVFAPQINLLTIGFPLVILVGLWIFAGSLGYVAYDFRHLFASAMRSIFLMQSHG